MKLKTTSSLYTQTHHYSSLSSPPPPTTNLHRFHHHHHHHNVRRRPDLTMPLRDLTIRRITTSRNNFRFNQATESFSIAESHRQIQMAEERKNNDVSQEQADTTALSVRKITEEKDKESEKSTPAVPPPEKPLPGDCCGSGCVRCVWDIYYEELDEYNKLHKVDPKIS